MGTQNSAPVGRFSALLIPLRPAAMRGSMMPGDLGRSAEKRRGVAAGASDARCVLRAKAGSPAARPPPEHPDRSIAHAAAQSPRAAMASLFFPC